MKTKSVVLPNAVPSKHGEKELSELLADALSKSGHVDRGTHSFHTYPAAMHPDMAKLIISELPGAVHDPFCGGGTVLIEGRDGKSSSFRL